MVAQRESARALAAVEEEKVLHSQRVREAENQLAKREAEAQRLASEIEASRAALMAERAQLRRQTELDVADIKQIKRALEKRQAAMDEDLAARQAAVDAAMAAAKAEAAAAAEAVAQEKARWEQEAAAAERGARAARGGTSRTDRRVPRVVAREDVDEGRARSAVGRAALVARGCGVGAHAFEDTLLHDRCRDGASHAASSPRRRVKLL